MKRPGIEAGLFEDQRPQSFDSYTQGQIIKWLPSGQAVAYKKRNNRMTEIFWWWLFYKAVEIIEYGSIKILDGHRMSMIGFLLDWGFFTFYEALEKIADVTKMENYCSFLSSESKYYYFSILIDLVKNDFTHLLLYKKNPSGNENIKLLRSEIKTIGISSYKEYFFKKSEFYGCLNQQKKLWDRNEWIHKRMTEIEASGLFGREYEYLQEEREYISKRLRLNFSEYKNL